MKRFIFDSILDEENICNLGKEKHKIMKGVDSGLKLLVYGKRNMGKTSLVKNVIAKSWLRHQSSGFFMYVDLMGVKQLSQISERMTVAFSEAYNACFKMKSVFDNMLKIIKGIRPSIELDEKGYPKLSFGIVEGGKIRPLADILKQLDLIYTSNIPILLVLDEFQDIALIDEAEALFRNGLEHIDSRIPVVILGSKQHLLNRIFARPKAPFFNWGTHVYFEAINYHEYWQYMDERFKQEGFRISFENAKYLQDKMSRMPEAINRLCFALLFHDIPKGEITKEDIDSGRTGNLFIRLYGIGTEGNCQHGENGACAASPGEGFHQKHQFDCTRGSENNDKTRERGHCLQGGCRLHTDRSALETAYFKI